MAGTPTPLHCQAFPVTHVSRELRAANLLRHTPERVGEDELRFHAPVRPYVRSAVGVSFAVIETVPVAVLDEHEISLSNICALTPRFELESNRLTAGRSAVKLDEIELFSYLVARTGFEPAT